MIDVPTLQQLLKVLKTVDNWFVFGVHLGVPMDQLNKIELSYHQKDLERYKIEMLQYWLENNKNASWKNVVQALEQTDQLALAETVKQQYLCSDEGEGNFDVSLDSNTTFTTYIAIHVHVLWARGSVAHM